MNLTVKETAYQIIYSTNGTENFGDMSTNSCMYYNFILTVLFSLLLIVFALVIVTSLAILTQFVVFTLFDIVTLCDN